MGKEEEQVSDDNNSSKPAVPPKIDKIETDEDDTKKSSNQKEEKPSVKQEEKKNPDELRKVIKLNNTEETSQQKKPTTPKPGAMVDELEDTSRETMEQKRAILQSIKDFDFQIKKNSEEITSLNKKLDSITKDLDDLVSLYEIVSEQMNPFVGLSKVTKKRIEALENFTKEVEDLKNRMGEIEAFADNTGVDLKYLQDHQVKGSVSVNEVKQLKTDENEDVDLDLVIDKILNEVDFDKELDNLINEFIESIKI